MNSMASQSSSSGCVGLSPWLPKSSLVCTSPRPNKASQKRFTVTRAVSGFSSLTSQRARPRRFAGASSGSGPKTAGTAGVDPLARAHEASAVAEEGRGPLEPARSFITRAVGTFMSSSSRWTWARRSRVLSRELRERPVPREERRRLLARYAPGRSVEDLADLGRHG